MTIINPNFSAYMGPIKDKDRTLAYAGLVDVGLTEGRINPPLTTRCPECDSDFSDLDEAHEDTDHIIIATTSDTTAVIVACEGYWMVDPGLVGLPRNGWTNPQGVEPFNDKGYPACPGATWENPHYLCFMERRDLDNCPECDTPIPDELKLNADMTGPLCVLEASPND